MREESAADGWAVWVYSEDEIARAEAELERFRMNPTDERYRAFERATPVRANPEPVRAREVRLGEAWRGEGTWGRTPVTGLLLALCLIMAVLTGGGTAAPLVRALQFTGAVFSGQVWRIWTPVLLHFGWLHLLFNCLWMHHLGRMVEMRIEWRRFGLMVLIIAALSNTAQYMATGPGFGGLSGVNYGLFAYVWVRQRYDPASGLHLDTLNTWLLIAWFVLGWLGWAGPMANWTHGIGLVTGAVAGWIACHPRFR